MRKLVRDRIPETGVSPTFEQAPEEERWGLLTAKLEEEAHEVALAPTAEARRDELADVLEVLVTLADHENMTLAGLAAAAHAKRAERGGFDTFTVLCW